MGTTQEQRQPLRVGRVGLVDAFDDERVRASAALDELVQEVDQPVGDPAGPRPGVEAGPFVGRRGRRQRLASARDRAGQLRRDGEDLDVVAGHELRPAPQHVGHDGPHEVTGSGVGATSPAVGVDGGEDVVGRAGRAIADPQAVAQ